FVLATRPAVRGLAKERPATLAVLPMRNATGEAKHDAVVANVLPELLGAALRFDEKLSIVPAAAVAQAMGTLKLRPGAAPEAADRARLARFLACRLTLEGTVSRAGKEAVLEYA